jgi:hypothetical protein
METKMAEISAIIVFRDAKSADLNVYIDGKKVGEILRVSNEDADTLERMINAHGKCIHCGGEFDRENNPPAGLMCVRCDLDFHQPGTPCPNCGAVYDKRGICQICKKED